MRPSAAACRDPCGRRRLRHQRHPPGRGVAQEATASACLIVDFGAMSFLVTSGLSVLLRAHHYAVRQGTMLCLAAPPNRPLRLLAVTGALSHLHVDLTVHDAIEAAAAARTAGEGGDRARPTAYGPLPAAEARPRNHLDRLSTRLGRNTPPGTRTLHPLAAQPVRGQVPLAEVSRWTALSACCSDGWVWNSWQVPVICRRRRTRSCGEFGYFHDILITPHWEFTTAELPKAFRIAFDIRRELRRTCRQDSKEVRLFKMMLASTVVVALLVGSAVPVHASRTENYGEYSRMSVRSAGQFWADGKAAGQWAWKPQSSTTSGISWGDPATWPPDSSETFIREGDWVMLDGWADNGTYYKLRITKEQIGDGRCQNLQTLATTGRQHYVKWDIPSQPYCLKAWGTLTEESSGKVVSFGHTQIWSPPAPCSNPHYGTQTCIKQWESWWDDQSAPGKPITRKLERDQYIARDIGMAFTIMQYYPKQWRADLRSHWIW
ncbi:STAS domain-containing protein [Nonomuraea sp. NPDC059007]|uniref:STAS domain-containing protein n=1 Tax=Nonomuraea sp. NPDC059007 TaxID=3346692 RepID=UPI0036AA3BCE